MAILVVAGLGNPGAAYEGTRHNAGFLLLDALAAEFGCSWTRDRKGEILHAAVRRGDRTIHLVKPQTYVNNSGKCLHAFCRYYRIPADSLVVAYDEVNLPVARAKISIGGSAGGHNGIADILRYFPNEFARFRLGIGPKEPPQIPLRDYVLGRFRSAEEEAFRRGMKGFVDGMKLVIDSGPRAAMNRVNQRPGENSETDPETTTNRVQEAENEDSRD